MIVTTRTATAAVALLIGAGALPLAATAQTETESQVEVEVIETEQAAEEAGQAVEAGVQEAGEAVEAGVQETGEALEAAEIEVEEEMAEDEVLAEEQRLELEQAAAEGAPIPPAEMIIGLQKEGQWLSSDLEGREVRNAEGEDIGDIEGVLFTEDGPVGVIVEVGGFLGLGAKEVGVRWEELSLTEEGGVMLNVTEEALENAPEFVSIEEREAKVAAETEAEPEQAAQQAETVEPATEPAFGEPVEGETETTQ